MIHCRYMLVGKARADRFFAKLMRYSDLNNGVIRGRDRFVRHFVGMYLSGKCVSYINPVVIAYTSDSTSGCGDGSYQRIRCPESAYSVDAHASYPYDGNLITSIPVVAYARSYFRIIGGGYYRNPSSGMPHVSLSVHTYTGLETYVVLSANDILRMQYRIITDDEFEKICEPFSDDRAAESYRLHMGDGTTVDYMSKSYDSAAMEYNIKNIGGMCITDKSPAGATVALYADRPEMMD